MNPTKRNVNRETIIDTAVLMIDENDGIKDVTLRAIGQRMGCAHTNLYNYFGSLEEIYWECLGRAMLIMLDEMGREDLPVPDQEEKLFLSLSRMMDFFFAHPGWHRLIWLEPLRGKPPQNVEAVISLASGSFARQVVKASGAVLSDARVNQLCHIMYCYLYGEINTWMTHRHEMGTCEKVKESTQDNLRFLFRLALEDNRKNIEIKE